eukprot:tig00020537_g10227.t1
MARLAAVLLCTLALVCEAWTPYNLPLMRMRKYGPQRVPGRPGAGAFVEKGPAACASGRHKGELFELVHRPGVFAMVTSAVGICDAHFVPQSTPSSAVYVDDVERCATERIMVATQNETSPRLVVDLGLPNALLEYIEIEAPLPACARPSEAGEAAGEACDAAAAPEPGPISVRLWTQYGTGAGEWTLEGRRLHCIHPGVEAKLLEIQAPGEARRLLLSRLAVYTRLDAMAARHPAFFNATQGALAA